ncbi:B3/B4 domain-containing protein [Natribacillus halophilus]|uniref:B3/B4 domain-containing protein (DNA/RNA-binding domain of Phe-tRNA-synthetase) n=1 Tax=Natribacillus halophilus TaxID=549003 RepID=A0A1G8NSY5_9BACI|nr:phenylalanine--tRNA ligase beta subunit-related protein [Natribacillus halophilus]SDI83293.1 B3/B4 domain-containing protein (DNA/RNA-binding domain of Phe-tRNA-synthetase) [Natribacillus halophilus]
MIPISLHPSLFQTVPTFKIGCISYTSVTIDTPPQELQGRIDLFQKTVELDLEEHPLTYYEGVKEWRQVFKQLGMDPGRYRPSHEALFRRLKQGKGFPSSDSSAIMLNNFFSAYYQIPIGLYDSDKLKESVEVRLGKETDEYEGLNGRINHMKGKLTNVDHQGAFGSPIVDSKRSAVTPETENILQLLYLPPSLSTDDANDLTESIGEMFRQIHSGYVKTAVLTEQQPQTH